MTKLEPRPLTFDAIDDFVPDVGAASRFGATIHKVAMHAQNGERERAGQAAREAIEDGAREFRLFASYYLACLDGAPSFPIAGFAARIAQCMQRATGDENALLRRREIGAPLHATLRDAFELIRFRASTKDQVWQRWVESYTRENWLADLQALDELVAATQSATESERMQLADTPSTKSNPWEEATSVVAKFRRWLAERGSLMVRESTRESTPIEEVDVKVSEKEQVGNMEASQSSQRNPPTLDESQPGGSVDESSRPQQGATSAAWLNLCERFEALSVLVAAGSHLRATALAADIEHELAGFDPSTYFPHIFSRYYHALSRLRGFAGHSHGGLDGDTCEVLRRYCRSDLHGFVADEALDELYEAS